MSKRLPIIRLGRRAAFERLFRGLYDLGYEYCSISDVDVAWPRCGAATYPDGDERHMFINQANGIDGSSLEQDMETYTLMNSVEHFLSYAKSLRDKSTPQPIDAAPIVTSSHTLNADALAKYQRLVDSWLGPSV